MLGATQGGVTVAKPTPIFPSSMRNKPCTHPRIKYESNSGIPYCAVCGVDVDDREDERAKA